MNAAAIITAIVQVFCGNANPDALIRIAERESRLTPNVIGDKTRGAKAYDKMRDALVASGNPWADIRSRWLGSFGLFQFMPAFYIGLWDKLADPHIFFDPRIATVCAGRLWNRAVAAGAQDFIEVRIFWAFGALKHRKGSSEYNKRFDKWSVVGGVMNPPVSAFNYAGFGTGPQSNQVSQVNRVPLTVQPKPQQSSLTWLPVAAAGLLAYAWQKRAAA